MLDYFTHQTETYVERSLFYGYCKMFSFYYADMYRKKVTIIYFLEPQYFSWRKVGIFLLLCRHARRCHAPVSRAGVTRRCHAPVSRAGVMLYLVRNQHRLHADIKVKNVKKSWIKDNDLFFSLV